MVNNSNLDIYEDSFQLPTREEIKLKIVAEINERVDNLLMSNEEKICNTEDANKFSFTNNFKQFRKYIEEYFDDCFINCGKEERETYLENYNIIIRGLCGSKDFLILLEKFTKDSKIIRILDRTCRDLKSVIDKDNFDILFNLLRPKYPGSKFYGNYVSKKAKD